MKSSKFKDKIKKILGFLLNPKFLLCFGIGWLVTNGWSYILMIIGTYYQIGWMVAVAGAYLAFLWLPISPEKIVTFAIAIVLLRWLFPNDTKTLAVVKKLLQKTRDAFRSHKAKNTGKNSKKAIQTQKQTTEGVMTQYKKSIRYADLFWLFMAGSLLGVIIEGVYCIFRYGHWETHTVAVWGPFCIIYGIGAVILYVGAIFLKDKNYVFQFILFAFAATVMEFLCGALLKYGLHMRAWDYSGEFLNIDGLVCPTFTLAWGAMGLVFSKWCVPVLDKLFVKMRGKGWKIACTAMSLFMAVNLIFTSFCILRWSQRYRGIKPRGQGDVYIDQTWDDDRMQKRFCEWRFID